VHSLGCGWSGERLVQVMVDGDEGGNDRVEFEVPLLQAARELAAAASYISGSARASSKLGAWRASGMVADLIGKVQC